MTSAERLVDHDRAKKLLAVDEPSPCEVLNERGTSPFVIVVDHASNRIPRGLDDLGLSVADLRSHIAWDIGATQVARMLSGLLDAPCILQSYSRLVIDCNRPTYVLDSIPTATSEYGRPIPGNVGISPEQRRKRIQEIFDPYQKRIATLMDERDDDACRQSSSALIALHSFAPTWNGETRPWHVGLLYNRDPRLARAVIELLNDEQQQSNDKNGSGLVVGDNQPYVVSDEEDYAVPVHGEQRGIPHVEIEIRQDLISAPNGQARWAERLAGLLPRALDRVIMSSSQQD